MDPLVEDTAEESPEVLLLVAILKLATVINRPMRDGVADPQGLSLNEMRVLMSIGGEGQVAGHELAEIIGMQPMNVSRSLATLQERGWIEQVGDVRNRRRKPFRLSEVGKHSLVAMLPGVGEVAHFLFAGTPGREITDLTQRVEHLIDRIDEWQPPIARPHVKRA
jgi:DNA-binding MarR family transcriptional regulator